MGRVSTGNRKYVAEELWEIHQEIIRRLVLGQKAKEIARDLQITSQTVSNIRNSPIAQRRILSLQAARDESVIDITNRIKSMAPLAQQVLEDTMMCPAVADSIRVEIAKDMLDRAGYSPVRKTASMNVGVLTNDDLERFKDRAKALGHRSGSVVESSFVGSEIEIEDVDVDSPGEA